MPISAAATTTAPTRDRPPSARRARPHLRRRRRRCAGPPARSSRAAPTSSRSWPMAAVASPTDPIHFLGFSRERARGRRSRKRGWPAPMSRRMSTRTTRSAAASRRRPLARALQPDPGGDGQARRREGRRRRADPRDLRQARAGGRKLGFPPNSVAKVEDVRLAGMESLAIMRKAGLPMAYGSDLLGEMHRHQSEEFVIRGRVLPAHEVIASATHVAAKLLRHGRPDRHRRAGRLCRPDRRRRRPAEATSRC